MVPEVKNSGVWEMVCMGKCTLTPLPPDPHTQPGGNL